VYEYVPDSEEATASQTESIISTSSIDETDFQAKTKRFLENMEKLRKEIHEEHVTKKFEEQLVDQGLKTRAALYVYTSLLAQKIHTHAHTHTRVHTLGQLSLASLRLNGCMQPPGSLNRVPASAGVRARMSPLTGGR